MKTLLCLILLLVSGLAPAQEDPENPYNIPKDLLNFWKAYYAAKEVDDEDAMDSAIRRDQRPAEEVLDWLLDGLTQGEDYERQSECRELAWALDRVQRTEKYIERVRFVIALERADRGRRASGLARWAEGVAAEEEARAAGTPDAWVKAEEQYTKALDSFEGVGDIEYTFYTIGKLEMIAEIRERPGQRTQWLERLVEIGDRLPFDDPDVERARRSLDALLAEAERKGVEKIEVEKEKGRTLDAYAEGSDLVTFPLEAKTPKKGMGDYQLPVFAPFEQFFLWPVTEVDGQGPNDFDNLRTNAVLQPHRTRWQLGRDGLAKFYVDVDGDFKGDIEFTPSTQPQLIEIPDPDGGPPYPLWICTGDQRELWFEFEVNHQPAEAAGQLRFFPAQWLEGDVLGDKWRIIDLNMDSTYGMHAPYFSDYITWSTETEGVTYGEVDAVLIGKAKKAIPFSTVMEVDGKWYRMHATQDEVSARELDLATGTLKVDINLKTQPDFLIVQEVSGKLQGAYFDIIPPKKGRPVTLPVGEYQILQGVITSGKTTGMDTIRIYTGDSEPFSIYEDTETAIELGGPFKLDFKVETIGENFIIRTRTMRIFGQGGEEYARIWDDALQPVISVRNEAGKMIEKKIKTRRPNIGHWQEMGDGVLYFPLEHKMVNVTGDRWEAKMTAKSHKLLGGPFESDWIK